MIKIDAAEYIPHIIILPCQKLAPALPTIQLEHRQFNFISIRVLLGPSAGEGWLPGGGVGKLQEGSARLPLH